MFPLNKTKKATLFFLATHFSLQGGILAPTS